jgi:transcriptional regulator with XRE-family HTH domain
MKFLQNLEYLLYKNHMSRSELARSINLAPSTVNSWFNRSCENVSLKSLVDISKYFGVSLDDLVNADLSAVPVVDGKLSAKEIEQLKQLLARYDLGGGKV